MQDYSEIQNAFLDGLDELFSIMFTDKIKLSLLNEESTRVNVYDESPRKVYLEPIFLVGKVTTTFTQGEDPIEGVQNNAVITIPTKQLISKGIPHQSSKDLETLKKGKMSYGDFEYLIEKVTPKTLVADKWQMYDFHCRVDKKTSLRGD